MRLLDGDAYGVSVKRLLDRETNRDVTIGAVYSALDRLEGKGLLRSSMTSGGSERGGRSRRSFTLTAEGRKRLVQMRDIRDRLWLQALRNETGRS